MIITGYGWASYKSNITIDLNKIVVTKLKHYKKAMKINITDNIYTIVEYRGCKINLKYILFIIYCYYSNWTTDTNVYQIVNRTENVNEIKEK